MGKLFSPDGPVMAAFTLIYELFLLNIVWLLCSIPIVTMGASTAALLTMTARIVEQRDAHVVRSFFAAFARNFKRGTAVGLIMLLGGAIAAADLYMAFVPAAQRLLGGLSLALTPVAVLFTAVWLMELVWVFAILTRYDYPVGKTLSRAFFTALGRLPFTLVMIAVPALLIFITVRVTALIPVWIFIGVAGVALLLSFLYHRLLPEAEPENKPDHSAER